MSDRTVDLLIPTYKPNKDLFRLLGRIRKQDYPVRKIYIVNTDEQYWDPAIEEEYPEVIVTQIPEDAFDHGGTRHAMAKRSEADLLLFMTQDALPADTHMVGNLAAQFQETRSGEKNVHAGGKNAPPADRGVRVAAAYARQVPKRGAGVLDQMSRSFNYPEESRVKTKKDLETLGIKTYFCSDVCAMYDRAVYMELGGFPRPAIFNEDMIFASRLIQEGYGVAYAADARVQHSHNYSASQQFHRNFNIGVSQAQHPEVFQAFPSEGEGIRLVKESAANLRKQNKGYLVVPLFWQSACKYAGYWLGKHYRNLPGPLVRSISQNRSYWEKEEKSRAEKENS